MNRIFRRVVSCRSLIVVCFISLASSSCEKHRAPLFAGEWEFKETITSGDLTLNTTRLMTLTKTTYEETFIVERQNSSVISSIIATRGNIEPAHSDLIFHLKELGTCIPDDLGACTGNIAWHDEGSQYWEDNITFFSLTVSGRFEVDETTLWLIRDLNDDLDTGDAGEDIIFTRI